MSAGLEERISTYRERHPNAGDAEIAGHMCAEYGADLSAVQQALGARDAEQDEDRDAPNPETDSGQSEAFTGGAWTHIDFAEYQSGVWAREATLRDQWMCHEHGDKKPFAPWGDKSPALPCNKCDEELVADCWHDGRYKWGHSGNHGTHAEAVEWADMHPDLSGVAYIQRDDDPLAFVDGDDVRDPDTGQVHPVFRAVLEHLGLTYADISTSGAGAHAVYIGELPDGVKQATWQIDTEPWGSNDDPPAIEIYDGKHVCVATGDKVTDTPEAAREWDESALEAVLEANGFMASEEPASSAHEEFNSEEYEPKATTSSETTDDIRDVFKAVDRLDAQRVAQDTIVHSWNDSAGTSPGERAFAPTWGPKATGRANIVNSDRWLDTGQRDGYGGVVCMAAIDAGLVDDDECPEAVDGATWWKAVRYLRDELGYDVPKYVGSEWGKRDALGLDDDTDDDKEKMDQLLAEIELSSR